MKPSKISRLMFATALSVASSITVAGGDAEAGAKRSQELGCMACHGPDGNGADPRVANVPNLAGQYEDYIVQALKDYRSGARANPMMSGFAGTLSNDDRQNLAAYYASQKGLRTLKR